MASISIDIAAVVGEIREIVCSIQENRVAQKEKRKVAQLLVYRALSLHPALEDMKPPTGMLADVDWYHELRKPSFVAGIFRKLGQNEHFKTTALLGETGTRARIMMLLLWIIGHRLSEDEVGRLLSHTLGDAFRATNSLSVTSATELMQLDSVKPVMVSLRKMIKTKLPLPPDRNPFLGEDYNPADEDKALPRAELWGYELPEELRYEYDVRRNPSLLLRPLPGSVIIPQTKLTLLLIRWASSNFGLGKKIYSAEEIDSEAFWNADPPEDDGAEMLPMDWSSDEGDDSYAFEINNGMATPIYEVRFDGPLDDWIHDRFCVMYPVHGWAHNSFVRVVLFNLFCSTQSFPEERDIISAIHIADCLYQKYPLEVILYMQPFIIARSLLLWKENFERQRWVTNFSEWTRRQRGMALIFSDPVKWDMEQNVMDVELGVFREVREFLFDPLISCQHVGDILSLPLLSDSHRLSEEELPSLDFSECTCGECVSIYSSFSPSLQTFHQHYYFVAESRPDGCTAWVDAWEPVLQEAEDWFGELTSRIESQFMLYPILDEQRAGPAVLEVCRRMGINVGADISDAELLRFLVALATIGDYRPESTTARSSMAASSVTLPVPPGDSGLGYMVQRPWADDREEYHDAESRADHVLFVTGGWLYDLVGIDGITLLHSREDVSISHRTLFPGKISVICMPTFRPEFPGLLPQRHDEEEMQTLDFPRDYDDGDQGHTCIFLSNFKGDGFPLLSVLDKGSTTPRGAVAAFIQVHVRGRIVETAHRPVVKCGSTCEHRERWGCMTHCAFTSYEILERVRPPGDGELSTRITAEIFASERSLVGQEAYILRRRMQVISDRLVKLVEAGSPLERNRACIIRCGARDGPIDPVIVLAASLKKKVYVIHRR
ncbi:hypothetical protein EDD18DRAFT_1358738 [Armillaria luteobubalina]|uniref:Uncharacterized protein n=1 Tax=Armillaria luteobubalina TaxID=153913 RepID=A0AA39PT70_9AGAR|nr:hypothetical protein EDD18DRAFT_1358738 [Armillaria luteobubalina]